MTKLTFILSLLVLSSFETTQLIAYGKSPSLPKDRTYTKNGDRSSTLTSLNSQLNFHRSEFPKQTKSNCRLQLILCALLYGSNYISTKLLQEKLSAPLVTFIRFFTASLLYIPGILSTEINWSAVQSGIEIGFWSGLGYISQAISLQKSTASKTAFCCGLGVLFVPLLDFFFDRRTEIDPTAPDNRSLSKFIAPFMAFLGVVSLECGGVEKPVWSDLWLLVTPVAFGMCFWRAEYHVRKFPKETHLITGSSIITISLLSLAWGLLADPRSALTHSGARSMPMSLSALGQLLKLFRTEWKLVAMLLHLGLLVTGLASNMEQNSLKLMSAAETSLIYTLEPLSGAGFAGLLLKEHIGRNTIAGAVFIVGACLYSSLDAIVSTSGQLLAFSSGLLGAIRGGSRPCHAETREEKGTCTQETPLRLQALAEKRSDGCGQPDRQRERARADKRIG